MSYDFFTDGIINSAVANGMIRIEFASISISEKEEDGRPKAQISHRMVMTPHGFLKSLSNMEALADKLVKAGVIKDDKDDISNGPSKDVDKSFSGNCRRKRSLVVGE